METLVYSAIEFRTELKKALDHAEAGGEVVVLRRGKPFMLKLAKIEVAGK